MAIAQAGIVVEHREVLLRDKPRQMLEISAKGTVPVLQLLGGRVIDESREIMLSALDCQDKDIIVLLNKIGGEDKTDQERRAPLAPRHVRELTGSQQLRFLVESLPSRIFFRCSTASGITILFFVSNPSL